MLYVNGVLTTTQPQQARSLSTNIAGKGERDLAVTKKKSSTNNDKTYMKTDNLRVTRLQK